MAKKELEDSTAVQAKKVAQLEQLCRALSGRGGQTERTEQPAEEAPCSTPWILIFFSSSTRIYPTP